MRRTLLVAAAAILLATTVKAQKEKKETIEGNGKMITKEVPVSSFESLKASGVFELKLSQGNTESVKIEADENLQQYFVVRNAGKKLVIEMKETKNKNMNLKQKLRVFVSFKNLKEMDLSMVGNVQGDASLNFSDLEINNNSVGQVNLNLSANNLNLNNNSVGEVKLSGKAQHAVIKHSSVGSLEAGNFVVQTMNIDNSGVGGAEVNAAKELKVSDNMLGKVKNKGTAPVKKINKVEI